MGMNANFKLMLIWNNFYRTINRTKKVTQVHDDSFQKVSREESEPGRKSGPQ
jgi:hypothetical protein